MDRTNNLFLYTPAVFAVENTYQIMAISEEEILYFVEPIAWLVALLLVMIPYYCFYQKKLLN